MNSSKDNLVLGLPTLDKILEPISKMSLLLYAESLNSLVKKKPYCKIVPIKKLNQRRKLIVI